MAPPLVGTASQAQLHEQGVGLARRQTARTTLPFVVLDYPVIVVARRPSPLRSRAAWPTGSPLDIERAATLMTEELPARVRDVRASGTLTDVDQLLAEPGG